jgi:hypothetical protein
MSPCQNNLFNPLTSILAVSKNTNATCYTALNAGNLGPLRQLYLCACLYVLHVSPPNATRSQTGVSIYQRRVGYV